jgi:hypothetical protein
MKKIIMTEALSGTSGDSSLHTSESSSGAVSLGDNTGAYSNTVNTSSTLKNDGSETSQLGDASLQMDDYDDDYDVLNEKTNDTHDTDALKQMIMDTNRMSIGRNEVVANPRRHSTSNSVKSNTSTNHQFVHTNKSSNEFSSRHSTNTQAAPTSPTTNATSRLSISSGREIFNFGDSLKRRSGVTGEQRVTQVGFATIKTAQAIVSEEQSLREHQDMIEFQNLKRQHTKLLKALETKLKSELDELKFKCDKEYNQDVQQFSKELDAICLRHLKELEELQRYNLNEERKYLNNGKEQNAKELKQHINELQSEYKRRKDELKRDIASKVNTSREKEECIKVGKERLHADIKQKEDAKRKQLEMRLTEEMCMLKRKHMVMFHKREYDLLLNVSTTQFDTT